MNLNRGNYIKVVAFSKLENIVARSVLDDGAIFNPEVLPV